MAADVDAVIAELVREGFAKLTGALPSPLIARLQDVAVDMQQRPAKPWAAATDWYVDRAWAPTLFGEPGQPMNFYDCLGVDPRLDEVAETIVTTPAIRQLLDRVVGEDRRIWFVQLRWAMPDAPEYPMHQDVYGELGLCIYLSEHPDCRGSMMLWPRSHHWPRLLEGFPLVTPRSVPDRVSFVAGVPGDVCVFFNKTWHGRTSAVGASRLVMLISFIPPGPREMGRRPPEPARAGFGPELRRLTASDAALPFGDDPPAAPPLSTTFELPANRPVTAEVEAATLSYAAGWASTDVDPQAPGATERRLHRHAGFVREAMLSAVVPNAVLDALLDDFGSRVLAAGHGPRAVHALRCEVAVWNGELACAREQYRRARQAPADALCSDDLLARQSALPLHLAEGDDQRAVAAVAAPLRAGTLTAVDRAALLLPLVRLGCAEEAAVVHARFDEIRGDPSQALAVGRHLEFLALHADPEPALAVLREHLGVFELQHNAGGLWHFWCGAWLLVERLRRAGVASVAGRLPRLGDGPFEVDGLTAHFRGRLEDLAARLDARNRNRARAARLGVLEDWVEWPAMALRRRT